MLQTEGSDLVYWIQHTWVILGMVEHSISDVLLKWKMMTWGCTLDIPGKHHPMKPPASSVSRERRAPHCNLDHCQHYPEASSVSSRGGYWYFLHISLPLPHFLPFDISLRMKDKRCCWSNGGDESISQNVCLLPTGHSSLRHHLLRVPWCALQSWALWHLWDYLTMN